MRLFLLTGILLVAAGAHALVPPVATELSDPDTTSEPRVVPDIVEPQRQPRTFARQQRVISVRYPQAREGRDLFSASVPELVAFANRVTYFEETLFVAGAARLSDPTLGAPLLLVLTGNQGELAFEPGEKVWLGAYLTGGGLLYAEDIRPPIGRFAGSQAARSGTPFDRQLKKLLADRRVLGQAGRRWLPVPHDHPLYQAFFTFPAGPPISGAGGGGDSRVTQLEMLELRGRPVAVFSDLNISTAWSSIEVEGRRRALQFGTNVLVFALAQQHARRIER